MTINTIILNKFGWTEYSHFLNRTKYFTSTKNKNIEFTILSDDIRVLYFYYEFFIIQNPNTKAYFFVKVKDEDIKNKVVDITKCELFLIKTNQDLFKLIIKNEAFSESYQRHFRINKILKQ